MLDIGCGDGKVTALIGSLLPNGHVTGIDSSEEMISQARKSFPASYHPLILFTLMNAMDIQYEEQFDLVYSNAALHWVPDHACVLHGVARSLKRGGRIFFQIGGKGNAQDVMNIAETLIRESPWKNFFHAFIPPYTFLSSEEYWVLLKDAGVTAIRAERIPKDMAQDGKEGLSGWIRTTWFPYTERVPEFMRDRFVSDLADTYMEEYPPDSRGQIT